MLAHWLPLDGVTSCQICILTFGSACWWASIRVRDRPAEGQVERALLDVLPGLFLVAAGTDFGQREHLMAVGALPYLLAADRRAAGARPRGWLAAALLSAPMFALKPHFLAVPALAELCVLTARFQSVGGLARAVAWTLRDPMPYVMAACWGVYLASLPLLFPAYLHEVLPLVWAYYVDLGGLTVWRTLIEPRMGTVLCLLAPLLWLAAQHPRPLSQPGGAFPRLLALAALGAMAAALVEHKGWSYHVLPIALFTCALACVLAARWVDRLRGPAARPRHAAAALAGLFALYSVATGEAPWAELRYPNDEVAALTDLLRPIAHDQGVLVLSPAVYPIYPALNYIGAHQTLRTMDMWLLQGGYQECLPGGKRYHEPDEMSPTERFFFRTVAEDFARERPAAVVVDSDPGMPWCGQAFDFIAYFSRHTVFAATWSHYRPAGQWGRFRMYRRQN